jgi:Tfp pilus assembly protein PilO
MTVSLLCGYAAYSQAQKKKNAFQVEQEVLHRRLKEVDFAQTSLQELKSILDATKEELGGLNERIPEEGKIGVLLKQIDASLKQRNLALLSLQPMPPTQEKEYLRNQIRLAFTGSFRDIYRLIHDLERMNRIMVMEDLKISRAKQTGTCTAELTVSVFERQRFNT